MHTVYVGDLAVISCRNIERAKEEAARARAYHPRKDVFVMPAQP